MWISLRLLISCAARIQHLSAARSRISCVSFSRRTGFQSLSPGLHTDHRHRPGTSENTFLEFPLVIAAVTRFSRKRGLWLVVCLNIKSQALNAKNITGFCVLSFSQFPFCFFVHIQQPSNFAISSLKRSSAVP